MSRTIKYGGRDARLPYAALGGIALSVAGCSDPASAADSTGHEQTTTESKYVAGSVVFTPDGEQTYLNVLDTIGSQTLDYDRAVELPGWSDMWVHEGHLFTSSREDGTVTKYSVGDDGSLREVGGPMSFTAHDIDVAFWSNTFVAPDKAYMIEGTTGYVIWNPQTMKIEGSFELPSFPSSEDRADGLILRAGTLDRANVIRDGKLYQPMYWSDEDYARFAPESKIVVIDIATDAVEKVIDAPCAGLDIGAKDETGNLYFSTWTGGVFEPLVLGAPPNCVVKVAAGEDEASVAFYFADIAEGREGAAVRAFEGGKLLISIFHSERVDLKAAEDPWVDIGDLNWRTWLYDPATESASVVESLEFNSGATYIWPIDGAHQVMVPSTDYAATTLVTLDGALDATPRFDMNGWGTRVFRVR